MPIYAVEYTYSEDDDARTRYRAEHRAYLTSLGEQDVVLASGPFAAHESAGALVIVRADREEDVRQVVEDDPFRVHGVIERYRATEWEPIIGRWAQALGG